jgi:hypothetical protein
LYQEKSGNHALGTASSKSELVLPGNLRSDFVRHALHVEGKGIVVIVGRLVVEVE